MSRPLDPLIGRSKLAVKLAMLVTRNALSSVSGVLWQFVDGSGATRADVDSFQGIGSVGFPADGSDTAECVRILDGGKPSSQIGIAARDEAMRTANADIAGATGGVNGAHAIFNAISYCWVNSDGDVVVKAGTNRKVILTDEEAGAGAASLATKADVTALAAFLEDQFDTAAGHVHIGVTPGGGATGAPTTGTGSGTGFLVPKPTGTVVVEGK